MLDKARTRDLLSDEHCTVDGTLLESWAAMKSFRPKEPAEASEQQDTGRGESQDGGPLAAHGGRNPEVDFHAEKRRNATHTSTTAPDARLMCNGNGKESKLHVMGHVLMENRNGLTADTLPTYATGTAEREAARVLDRRPEPQRHGTVAADKAYDTRDVVAKCRDRGMTPHVAQNTRGRRSAIDRRTTRHPATPSVSGLEVPAVC